MAPINDELKYKNKEQKICFGENIHYNVFILHAIYFFLLFPSVAC